MRSLIFLILITLINANVFSQKKRKTISGIIKLDSIAVRDVHIVNINTNVGTVSNDNGFFEIPVQISDTLQFSHINYKKKRLIITADNSTSLTMLILLEERIDQLNGFTLEKPRSIFYVDPSIKKYTGPTVNAKTLKLPYANSVRKPNTAIVKISSGGLISIDNLINTLNGNKRRKKIVEKIASEYRSLQKIRTYFTDDFFITNLQIKKENINPFLNFCIQKNIISIFNQKENIKLTKILVSESKRFPQKQKTETKVVFKKK